MQRSTPRCLVALALAACAPTHAAESFAAAGARATLEVDYLYESSGRKRSEGMYDPYEWRVKRSLSLAAELAAQPATAMPTVQAIDASQMAQLKGKGEKVQAVATQMAPMMADAQKIMERCGDDEACISREAQKMGAAMSGTPRMAAAMNAKRDAEGLSRPDATRYQAWRASAQRGSYAIDESVRVSVPDPICASRPRQRCTREEVRKGSGEVPLPPGMKPGQAGTAGLSAVELDVAKNTLTVTLPVPMMMLPYTETITTDEPAGTHDTPTPRGPQARQLSFRVGGTTASGNAPFTVPLKGGVRNQSGERIVRLKGKFGEEGTLTVRWRFAMR